MSDWTKELFEEHAELFLGAFEERIAQTPAEVDYLLRRLKEQGFKPKNILDLNCGIGRHSIELGKRGITMLGTDLSSYYIEAAKKRAKIERMDNKVHFQVADMRKITSVLEREGPFDGIVNLWTSFGYYDNETNDDILRQCLQLVGEDGFFALDIINKDWLARNFQERSFERLKGRIVLEERRLDQSSSRMYNTWTYLKEKDEGAFVLEKRLVSTIMSGISMNSSRCSRELVGSSRRPILDSVNRKAIPR
jgi:2-polyprenyl-3-methyl-5-hydroxy-6-metoxy-1,4-benzoquinol methylase